MIRSLVIPTSGRRDIVKTLRPSVAADKLGYRIDWIRFARSVDIVEGVELERLGTSFGGYVIPRGLVEADWVCYSGGLGDDVSFEVELAKRYGCTIHGFDPMPAAIAIARAAAAEEPRLVPLEYGLWSRDEELKLFAPKDADHVSHSVANLQGTDEQVSVAGRSLPSVMAELGHDRIDFLKLDIEGAEYEVLDAMLAEGIEPHLLCLDVHKVKGVAEMVELVERLVAIGYVPVQLFRTDITLVREGSPALRSAAL